MKCIKCGDENPAGTRFCRRCGAAMTRSFWSRGLVVIGGIVAGLAAVLLFHSIKNNNQANEAAITPTSPPAPVAAANQPVNLGIAYGTEKQDWLIWAVQEFSRTHEGAGIHIDLKPMGSLDAAHAIARNDSSIQVWSPASSLYKDAFLREWKDGHPDSNPILKESPLALTPMVFVVWEQRYNAFKNHYLEMNFRTIGEAMNEKQGWAAIAERPDWMFFKFSHTNPPSSNSGLMSLVLMGYDYHAKHAGLDGHDITDAQFQTWVRSIERGLSGASSGLVKSTGDLMTAMVQRGWSTYDVIFVYESVAIDRLRQANGRWGALKVVYPKYNMWNENPYYVLDVPWCSAQQRQAADTFLAFLLSERVQQEAMTHGFRPANVQVPTNTPDSPLVKYQSVGLRSDAPGIFCDPPKAEVIENLLIAWQNSQSDAH